MSRGVFAALLAFLVLSSTPAAAESSKTGWDDVDFPVWAKDIRRAEIITLGSLPFVTLWTTLGYSIFEYGEFRNPLNKSSDSFTVEDQKKIIAVSAGACVALGIFDLLVTKASRSVRGRRVREGGAVTVRPGSGDGGARPDGGREYLMEGVCEDAVF